ncbi:MAG: alpha/beta fold hydrolase [Pseudorhodoplanes sp.]
MKERYIDAGGLRTCYYDEGQGPTIVLIHGAALGDDAYVTWYRNIEALKKSYRVIAFDQVCFGRTELPKDGKYKDRTERVDHAIAFLKALNIKDACLIGHSEGAFISCRIAILEPSLVSRLVIVTSGATAPYLGGDADAEWIKYAEGSYNDRAAMMQEDSFIECSFRLNYVRDPEFERLLRENYRRAKELGHFDLFMSQVTGTGDTDYSKRENTQRTLVWPYLKEMQIPILLVWSLNDPGVVVQRGVKLLEMLPMGEMHVFASAAHFVMQDRADDFNRLIAGWCAPDK